MAATICARDERANARNGHQLAATFAPMCQLFDLLGNMFDALIETTPITAEILDGPDHTGRQYINALSQDLRELVTQETKPLADYNVALQEETADLIDDSRPLAH
jgi:hypothetical protein